MRDVPRADGLPHQNGNRLSDPDHRNEGNGVQGEGDAGCGKNRLIDPPQNDDEGVEGGKIQKKLNPVRRTETDQTAEQFPVPDLRQGPESLPVPAGEEERRIQQNE